jgi:2-oxoisovalerate dehydrogenase E1 component alpha subunit
MSQAPANPVVPGIDPPTMRSLYRFMAITRALDEVAATLQRQGELAVYPPLVGQEAAQVGSAAAVRDEDWIVPSYRELGAAVVRGIDPVEYLAFYRATWHGGMWDPMAHRFAPICVPVASQIPHAVGIAMGAMLDRRDTCALVYFGDGATSQGDFHEACNWAGVFQAPVVFLCQNNQWAISMPLHGQTAAPIHRKAEAYGFPGIQVDGNDVLAVYSAVREAAGRARGGGGPTLIEALTYRIGAHSTADDAGRYRSAAEVDRWKALDPVARYRRRLQESGVAGEELFASVDEEAGELVASVRAGVVSMEPRPAGELFAWVYEDPPATFARQREEATGDA